MSSLRERKKQQTEEAIILSAVTLFERNGYDETTIEEVADAANVSPRTLLRYFDSKAALVLDWIKPKKDEFYVDLTLDRPASENTLEAVFALALAELHAELADTDRTRIILRQLRIVMSHPGLESLAASRFRDKRSGMARVIAALVGQPEDSLAVQVLTGAFAEMLWSGIQSWVRSGASLDDLDAMLSEAFGYLRDIGQ
jgi:AcrR family transcriptional regulator